MCDIFEYIKSGEYLDRIELILKEDYNNIYLKNQYKQNLLYIAASLNHYELIKLLIKYNVNIIDDIDLENQWNVLHRCLYSGHFKCASYIIKNNEKNAQKLLNMMDKELLTPTQLLAIRMNKINEKHLNYIPQYQYWSFGLSKFDQLGYVCKNLATLVPKRMDFNLQYNRNLMKIHCTNTCAIGFIENNDNDNDNDNNDDKKNINLIYGWGSANSGRLATGESHATYIEPTLLKSLIGLNVINCSISDGIGSAVTLSGAGVYWGKFNRVEKKIKPQLPKLIRFPNAHFVQSVATNNRILFLGDDRVSLYSLGQRLNEPNYFDETLQPLNTFQKLDDKIYQMKMNNKILIVLTSNGSIYQQKCGQRYFQKVLYNDKNNNNKKCTQYRIIKIELSENKGVALTSNGIIYTWEHKQNKPIFCIELGFYAHYPAIDMCVGKEYICIVNHYGQVIIKGHLGTINTKNDDIYILPQIYNAKAINGANDYIIVTTSSYMIPSDHMPNNSLVNVAANRLIQTITPSNIVHIVKLAHHLRINSLYQFCLNYIVKNLTQICIDVLKNCSNHILDDLETLFKQDYGDTSSKFMPIQNVLINSPIIESKQVIVKKLPKQHNFSMTNIRKRKRKLEKQLSKIQTLEDIVGNDNMDADQLRKVSMKFDLIDELSEIDKLLELQLKAEQPSSTNIIEGKEKIVIEPSNTSFIDHISSVSKKSTIKKGKRKKQRQKTTLPLNRIEDSLKSISNSKNQVPWSSPIINSQTSLPFSIKLEYEKKNQQEKKNEVRITSKKSWSPIVKNASPPLLSIQKNEESNMKLLSLSKKSSPLSSPSSTYSPISTPNSLSNYISAALPQRKWSLTSTSKKKKTLAEIQLEEEKVDIPTSSPVLQAWGYSPKKPTSPSLSDIQSQQYIENLQILELDSTPKTTPPKLSKKKRKTRNKKYYHKKKNHLNKIST